MIRGVTLLLLLCTATAQDATLFEQVAELGSSIYESAQQMFPQLFEQVSNAAEDAEHMWKSLQEAHKCREACGNDDACKAQCPKPWEPFLKVCSEVPAIKACHQTCNGKDCESCPRFSLEWLNNKFAKRPEKVMTMADEKCPLMEKAYACHQACAQGDHGCHGLCPHMKDIFHGHEHWKKNLRRQVRAARKCHHGCGTDGACHEKCPKPYAPFMKTCSEIPAVTACHQNCVVTDCQKCLNFTSDWVNRKFAKDPERIINMSQTKCPLMEQAHACHQACAHADHRCHHKCPHMTDIILGEPEDHENHKAHHKFWGHMMHAWHEEHESRHKHWGQEFHHGHKDHKEHESHDWHEEHEFHHPHGEHGGHHHGHEHGGQQENNDGEGDKMSNDSFQI